MRIDVDRSLCDGNGLCAERAPSHFQLDENDELRLLRSDVDQTSVVAVESAVQACPKSALQLRPSDER